MKGIIMKKIYIVGLGPGEEEQMTPQALTALENSDIIVGYNVYINLIRDKFSHKDFYSTPMRGEVERCKQAVDLALSGKTVSVISSGDAGVYGMAGLVYELCTAHPDIEIKAVSGITAASSGAAVLGAPLMHDFCVISLSDLLTPWEKIEKRLRLAAEADFVVCIYNPSSKKRADYLEKACKIMLEHKAPETVCGYVKNIGRTGEEYKITTLGQLKTESVDMFTTVFVGNSQTRVINGKMVTPRGYGL